MSDSIQTEEKSEATGSKYILTILISLCILAVFFVIIKVTNANGYDKQTKMASTSLKIAFVSLISNPSATNQNPIIFENLPQMDKDKVLNDLAMSFKSVYIKKSFNFGGDKPEIVFITQSKYYDGKGSIMSAKPNSFLVGLSDARPVLLNEEEINTVNLANYTLIKCK